MKFIFNLIFASCLVFLSVNSFAGPTSESVKSILEKQFDCGALVKVDDQNIYLGFARYKDNFEEPRTPIPGKLKVISIATGIPVDIDTDDGAIDAVNIQDSLYILTYSALEEWSLSSKTRLGKYPTYAISRPMLNHEHATAMGLYKNKLVISHGRLGLSIFDTEKKRVTNQMRLLKEQLPLESMATAISIIGDKAFLAFDNYHLVSPGAIPPFRGIAVIDLIQEIPLNYISGLDPGVEEIIADQDKTIVSYGGLIWTYQTNSLSGTKLPEPSSVIAHMPFAGHTYGKASVDDTYFYSCALMAPLKPGGNYVRRPVALSKKALGL